MCTDLGTHMRLHATLGVGIQDAANSDEEASMFKRKKEAKTKSNACAAATHAWKPSYTFPHSARLRHQPGSAHSTSWKRVGDPFHRAWANTWGGTKGKLFHVTPNSCQTGSCISQSCRSKPRQACPTTLVLSLHGAAGALPAACPLAACWLLPGRLLPAAWPPAVCCLSIKPSTDHERHCHGTCPVPPRQQAASSRPRERLPLQLPLGFAHA